jgi:hypothetical protein
MVQIAGFDWAQFFSVKPPWLLVEERQPEKPFSFFSRWCVFIEKLSRHD